MTVAEIKEYIRKRIVDLGLDTDIYEKSAYRIKQINITKSNDEKIDELENVYLMLDQLDEWVDVRDRLPSEDKDYFVTIKSRIDYADRYYIVLAHWEKSTTDKSVKGWWTSIGWNRAEKQHLYDITNDVVAWKKVEPYERKELENEQENNS